MQILVVYFKMITWLACDPANIKQEMSSYTSYSYWNSRFAPGRDVAPHGPCSFCFLITFWLPKFWGYSKVLNVHNLEVWGLSEFLLIFDALLVCPLQQQVVTNITVCTLLGRWNLVHCIFIGFYFPCSTTVIPITIILCVCVCEYFHSQMWLWAGHTTN